MVISGNEEITMVMEVVEVRFSHLNSTNSRHELLLTVLVVLIPVPLTN